ALAALSAPVVHAQQTWSLDGVKIYTAPDATPISGTVVIAGTKIQSVSPRSDTRATNPARAPQCQGGVLVAGFQNSHVHFTSDEFRNARGQTARVLEPALTRMLTQYGYTTVVDIASDRDNTLDLRKRIESGDVRGPEILIMGLPLFPPDGLPIYIARSEEHTSEL